MKYDVDYFIEKFEAIPEDKWITGNFIDWKGRCCALGHCGVVDSSFSEEASALNFIVRSALYTNIVDVNDGYNFKYRQPTPKQRVLAVLRKVKRLMDQTFEGDE